MKKKNTFSFKELDLAVKEGRTSEVRSYLETLETKNLDENLLVKLSSIARRVGRAGFGVKLLNPIVRPKFADHNPTQLTETWIEYANCLVRMGLLNEGISILKSIPKNEFPETLFALAAANMKAWNYETARENLNEYISSSNISEYRKTVGEVNLIDCLLATNDLDSASELIETILDHVDPKKNLLLYSHVLTLKCQMYIREEKFGLANDIIQKQDKLLENQDNKTASSNMFLKWKAICAVRTNPSSSNINNLIKVVENAKKTHNWESYRDSLFHLARAKNDINTLIKLYWGTPYIAFKNRIANIYPDVKNNTHYTINSNLSGCTFNLSSLKFSPQLLRLQKFLFSDLYKPFALVSLFSSVYPDEHFDPETSLNRVYQLIVRLRRRYVNSNIPIEINEKSKHYHIDTLSPVQISHSYFQESNNVRELILSEIISNYPEKGFVVSDLSVKLNLSSSYIRRILSQLVYQKILIVEGKGRKTRYFANFLTSSKSA